MRHIWTTSLLATTAAIGIDVGTAQACPGVIPAPATADDVICFTTGRDPLQRCATALPADICQAFINTAFNDNLLTLDAWTWLTNNGFCPMVLDAGAGPQIYDFCPRGCFADDTEILSSIGSKGELNYTPASKVTFDTPLTTVADSAELGTMSLTGRGIDRIVYGPETPDLVVFTLANGTVLRVTVHHPMVLDDGMIVEAEKVPEGSAFVGVDGESVPVVSIGHEKTDGNVFNFQTDGESQLSHIIVAHGVLVGDLKLQNELAVEQAAIDIRR